MKFSFPTVANFSAVFDKTIAMKNHIAKNRACTAPALNALVVDTFFQWLSG